MYDTTDPDLRSFIDIPEDSHFPIQNLPYCVFSPDARSSPRIGTAIGNYILDLAVLESEHLFRDILGKSSAVFSEPRLNPFMSLGPDVWHKVRSVISCLLRHDEPRLRDNDDLRPRALVRMTGAQLFMPVSIGDYTDFYASREHASNLGRLFRGPDNPLLPNWRHLPVAYHGRASSIIMSPAPVRRPSGQFLDPTTSRPKFGPTRQLDFELELGLFIGPGNDQGRPLRIGEAADHIFGFVLVNDWSARDIQRWEYQPLGPFLGKNFATSISPWVVSLEALKPFRCQGPPQDPAPLPHLRPVQDRAFDINLEVYLRPASVKKAGRITATNARYLYWDFYQQIAHHTSNGCNLRTGDLIASGTISGPGSGSYGSLIELTEGGSKPLQLDHNIRRTFLEDGDVITLTGFAQGPGFRIGFGEVSGTILPAHEENFSQ
jgi:fumarylacetoacetase